MGTSTGTVDGRVSVKRSVINGRRVLSDSVHMCMFSAHGLPDDRQAHRHVQNLLCTYSAREYFLILYATFACALPVGSIRRRVAKEHQGGFTHRRSRQQRSHSGRCRTRYYQYPHRRHRSTTGRSARLCGGRRGFVCLFREAPTGNVFTRYSMSLLSTALARVC